MELKQLQYFYSIAHYENFSMAAKELFIAQPALSKSMQKLEEELGVELFIRTNKTVKLSPAGRELKQSLSTILPTIASIGPHLQDIVNNYTETCTVSVLASLSYVTEIISRFSRDYPDVHININRSDNPFNSDFMVSSFEPDFETQNSILLRDTEFFVMVQRGSPLSKSLNVNLKDIIDTPFLQNSTSRSIKVRIEQAFEERGMTAHTRIDVAGCYNMLCYLVEQGLGYTITPNLPTLFSKYDVSLVTMENHSIRCPLYLIWKKSSYLTKSAKMLMHYVCDYFGVPADGIERES